LLEGERRDSEARGVALAVAGLYRREGLLAGSKHEMPPIQIDVQPALQQLERFREDQMVVHGVAAVGANPALAGIYSPLVSSAVLKNVTRSPITGFSMTLSRPFPRIGFAFVRHNFGFLRWT